MGQETLLWTSRKLRNGRTKGGKFAAGERTTSERTNEWMNGNVAWGPSEEMRESVGRGRQCACTDGARQIDNSR